MQVIKNKRKCCVQGLQEHREAEVCVCGGGGRFTSRQFSGCRHFRMSDDYVPTIIKKNGFFLKFFFQNLSIIKIYSVILLRFFNIRIVNSPVSILKDFVFTVWRFKASWLRIYTKNITSLWRFKRIIWKFTALNCKLYIHTYK